MSIIIETGQQFVGRVRTLGLNVDSTPRDKTVPETVPKVRVGDALRLDLRQADGAIVRVLGTVRSIKDADPDPGHSAILECLHPSPELELADWIRAWEMSALEQVDALVMLFDRRGAVCWANAAVERTIGWPTSELLGQPFALLQARLGLEIDLLRVVRCILRGGSWSASVQLQTRDGQARLAHVRVTAVRGSGGAIEGISAILRDETELHRLRSVAEAVNLAANVGQMFAGIRHELGNPINSLKTALTVLDANWRHFEVERIEHYFERMLVEVGRVEYLLRSLRTFSAFEHVQLRPCSVRALLTELGPVIATAARERGVNVELDLACTLWVQADGRALYQALLNLLINAMDAATKTHGWVTLGASRVGGGTVAIEVADNGEGIAAEDLESVLRPFFTTKPHGTGLGLPIVQRLVMAMGGELVIDSTRGQGTRARMLLPEVPADA